MNKLIINLRSTLRKLGVNKLIARFINSNVYEEKFQEAILKSLKPNYVVWDVGANIGFYSKKFAERTKNIVYAFEPIPYSCDILKDSCAAFSNVKVLPIALGSENTVIKMTANSSSPTNRVLSENENEHQQTINVDVRRGDDLISNDIEAPNFIKIDVEGFEVDVIKGLENILSLEDLKVIAIEIHFRLLEERGCKNGPLEISSILENKGFNLRWIDYSHLVALRA